MAGVVWATSFDHYTTPTHRWNTVDTSTPTIGAFGRNSTNGLRWGSVGNNNVALKATLPSALSTIFFAFAFRAAALPSVGGYSVFARIADAGGVLGELHLRSDGTIQVYRGNNTALLGTLSDFSMLPDVYYHFEWKTVVSATVGVVQVWVNEVSHLSLTSQNTGTTSIGQIQLNAAAQVGFFTNGNFDFDDVVVRDDQQIGDVQVLALLPTGTGSTDQWTANGAATTRECVDEAAPNSNTDYASESTVSDLSLWTYPTIPTTSTIQAVVPIPFAEKTDAGTAKFKSVVRIGGVNYAGVEQAPSDSSYAYHPDILMNSPATAVAFTPTEWNSIEVGVQRTA